MCKECRGRKGNIPCAAALEAIGPVTTFTNRLQTAPRLIKTAAAWTGMQFLQLKWPAPDYVVPIPPMWFRALFKEAPSFMLARELAHLLGCEVRRPLIRVQESGGEGSLQRDFFLKKKSSLSGKTVLLVDDLLDVRAFREASYALASQFPQRIYGLALASSIYTQKH